jgi:signal transduction histidine kinase
MPVADALVAVLRESLSNVARHARATATTITLEADADHVVLSVEDDGQGLPRSLVGGDGLANIRERAAKLGGAASIAPATDGGTRLVWTCPT